VESSSKPAREATPRNGTIDAAVGITVADGTGMNVAEGVDVAIGTGVDIVVAVDLSGRIIMAVLDGTKVTVDCLGDPQADITSTNNKTQNVNFFL
jgi:hypothetical protein